MTGTPSTPALQPEPEDDAAATADVAGDAVDVRAAVIAALKVALIVVGLSTPIVLLETRQGIDNHLVLDWRVPLVAVFVGPLLGLSGLYYQVAVLFAALPTASSAYILAVRMGGDGKSVAWLISASTLASMLTLTLWAAWLTG